MRVFNRGSVKVDEMTLDQRVEDYCELSVIEGEADKLMKAHRETLIKEYGTRGILVHEVNGRMLEVRIVKKKKVDIDELEKICKKKNVEVGKVYHIIHPKTGNIPAKVLETLDKYFTLETNLEVDVKDVEKAADIGLITKKDVKKIIGESESKSLYPKVKDEVNAQIIVD